MHPEKFLKKNLDRLAKVQRKQAANPSSKNKKIVAKVHQKISNCRNDWQHKCANHFIQIYLIIYHEGDLDLSGMLLETEGVTEPRKKASNINRSLLDLAIGLFIQKLIYKAEYAGRLAIGVKAKGTSSTCSCCGWVKEDLTLADRIFHCERCDLEIDRNYNATLNIMKRGRIQLAKQIESKSLGIQTPLFLESLIGFQKQARSPVL